MQAQESRYFLDLAAIAVSASLNSKGHQHVFIGGYATSFLGGNRYLSHLGVSIDSKPSKVQLELVAADTNFCITDDGRLVFRSNHYCGMRVDVNIRLFHGGRNQSLKLPDPRTAPRLYMELGDIKVPVLHPSVLVLTKVKRWMFYIESTRNASIIRSMLDFDDIQVILEWLKERKMQIDFAAYPEKSKMEIMPGFRMLHEKSAEAEALLSVTMAKEDFTFIRS